MGTNLFQMEALVVLRMAQKVVLNVQFLDWYCLGVVPNFTLKAWM